MNNFNIFEISNEPDFKALALETFNFQYRENPVYREFCDFMGRSANDVTDIPDIPFLPIQFFKSRRIVAGEHPKTEAIFTSSGTTTATVSRHYVMDLNLYEQSCRKAFEHFYGSISEYCILALLPSYLERDGSSLVYMVNDLIAKSRHPASGFYLNDLDNLHNKLRQLDGEGQKVLLIGVSFALLDMAETYSMDLKNTIVMETGGMKGRRTEMIREQLHLELSSGFGVENIHSEYGMTELLSQAYSKGNGVFETPPWMKVIIRDAEDPLFLQPFGKTGGINVMDLANRYSCSFIATQDLGRYYKDGTFEVIGRFDHSDIRGCNLMAL